MIGCSGEIKPGDLVEFQRLRDGRALVLRLVEQNTFAVELAGKSTLTGSYDVALDEFKRLGRRWGYG